MKNKQEYLERLQAVIQKMHGCGATYRRTASVHERFKGKTLWEGEVEVFWLTRHPRAKRCYAWSPTGWQNGGEQVVAVLEISPVIGPATAVKAVLAGRAGTAR